MVIIVNSNPEKTALIAALLDRFDNRLSYETASNCAHGWLITRACQPWLCICDAEEPGAFEYLVKVREFEPAPYFVFTGKPADNELAAHADAVVYNVTFERMLPHFRAARERQRRRKENSARRKSNTPPTASRQIQITVGTGEMKFTLQAPAGTSLLKFLALLEKQKMPEVRLFRDEELLGSDLNTVLEDGDRLELLNAEPPDARRGTP